MPLSVSAVLRRGRSAENSLAVVSLHDAPSARIACDAGADLLLVGDSAGNTLLGYEDTLSVTLDEMAMLSAAVARGVRLSSRTDVPIIADLPFAAYATPRQAVANGARLMRAGMSAVKLEGGGKSVRKAARALIESGIPVVGHLGYTPQFARGFNNVVQGRSANEAAALIESAGSLNETGICAVVLEAVAEETAQAITQLGVPTIGIGAGSHCDAQVLVWHDIVGISPGVPFRFVTRFGEAGQSMQQAIESYVRAVQGKTFPAEANGWHMNEGEAALLQSRLNGRSGASGRGGSF